MRYQTKRLSLSKVGVVHRKDAFHQALRGKLSRGWAMQAIIYPDVGDPTLKTVAHKTNNQASVGGSVLQAKLQLEVNKDLARHIDRKGANLIHTIWVGYTLCISFMHTVQTLHTLLIRVLEECTKCTVCSKRIQNSCPICRVCTKYAHRGEVHLLASKVHSVYTLVTLRASVLTYEIL